MIFHHIGVFVGDLEAGRDALAAVVPMREWGPTYEDPHLHVSVQFGLDTSGLRYEIVAPFGEPNPVTGALSKGRNILNHVAYLVNSVPDAAESLRRSGAIPMGPSQPAVAFGGAHVMFFLTALGMIVEIIEATEDARKVGPFAEQPYGRPSL